MPWTGSSPDAALDAPVPLCHQPALRGLMARTCSSLLRINCLENDGLMRLRPLPSPSFLHQAR